MLEFVFYYNHLGMMESFKIVLSVPQNRIEKMAEDQRPPLINRIQLSFRSLHLVSSVFGVSYLKYNKTPKFVQTFSILYTLTLFCLFELCFFYRILNVSPKLSRPHLVDHSVSGIQQILNTAAITTIFYQVLAYKTKFAKILKLIKIIDQIFASLNIHFTYNSFTTKIAAEIVLVLAFIYGSFIFFLIYYNVQDYTSIFLELFTSINPMLIISLNLLTFINLVWCIHEKFASLKRFLLNVCASNLLVANDVNDVWKIKLTSGTPNGLYRELKQIAHIYELSYKAVNQVNGIFGISNLASMGK